MAATATQTRHPAFDAWLGDHGPDAQFTEFETTYLEAVGKLQQAVNSRTEFEERAARGRAALTGLEPGKERDRVLAELSKVELEWHVLPDRVTVLAVSAAQAHLEYLHYAYYAAGLDVKTIQAEIDGLNEPHNRNRKRLDTFDHDRHRTGMSDSEAQVLREAIHKTATEVMTPLVARRDRAQLACNIAQALAAGYNSNVRLEGRVYWSVAIPRYAQRLARSVQPVQAGAR